MNPQPPARVDLTWRRREVAALLLLSALAGAVLAARAAARDLWPGCPPDRQALRRQLAADRIDPNTASAASLMRLPGVGTARAAAILDYRAAHPGRPFATLDDLARIKGIGPAAIRDLARTRQFLVIPEKP